MTLRVSYVADGPRDGAVLPALVSAIVGVENEAHFTAWREIRLHHGYDRKLAYAVRAAKARGADGAVAVVDNDGYALRLPGLLAARERSRHLGVPVAVGEAHPHVEAWLVDDLEALRSALGLDAHAKAPPGRNPKAELDDLIDLAGRSHERMACLGDLAREVRPERCRNSGRTGLARFTDEVRRELGPLSSSGGTGR